MFAWKVGSNYAVYYCRKEAVVNLISQRLTEEREIPAALCQLMTRELSPPTPHMSSGLQLESGSWDEYISINWTQLNIDIFPYIKETNSSGFS